MKDDLWITPLSPTRICIIYRLLLEGRVQIIFKDFQVTHHSSPSMSEQITLFLSVIERASMTPFAADTLFEELYS